MSRMGTGANFIATSRPVSSGKRLHQKVSASANAAPTDWGKHTAKQKVGKTQVERDNKISLSCILTLNPSLKALHGATCVCTSNWAHSDEGSPTGKAGAQHSTNVPLPWGGFPAFMGYRGSHFGTTTPVTTMPLCKSTSKSGFGVTQDGVCSC